MSVITFFGNLIRSVFIWCVETTYHRTRILLVDDDPDVTLTFKADLDGRYYGDGDKKKRFEAYTYNDPLLVVKEFKPHFTMFF